MNDRPGRRSGGRNARREARREGAGAGPSLAVWPGVEGGRYKPLTAPDVERIHETA